MTKIFRELTAEEKATCRVGEDPGDEGWVYCPTCRRAMHQGDCVLGEDNVLECAYEDCPPPGNLAFASLYGWDAYRAAYGQETAHWPKEPELGECYERPGASP